jgi:hypothetical protein
MTDSSALKASEDKVELRDQLLFEAFQQYGQHHSSYALFIASLDVHPRTPPLAPNAINAHRKRLHPHLRL